METFVFAVFCCRFGETEQASDIRPDEQRVIFLRRFAKKEKERKRNSDFQGGGGRKMMSTKSNVNAFVFGEEARRTGEEKETTASEEE